MHPKPADGMKNPIIHPLLRPFASREARGRVEIRIFSRQPRAV
jgi:hypothetical protein